jgi:hypothetical protein
MASLPIISSTSVCTSSIVASAKETHPEAIFQSCYEKLLTIHASILYLNKIKKLALSFTSRSTCNPSIHHTFKLNNQFPFEQGVIGLLGRWGVL